MDRRRTCLMLFLFGMLYSESNAQCVSVCNDDGTGYNSVIVGASDDFPNNFTLQWEPYPDPFYIVEYRLQDSGSQFISSPILTDETYTITNLSPETDYEVRVCLANGTENDCGNCLKCFKTDTAEEPPGPPREVQGISSGPQSFIIMWEEPTITNGGITGYIVSFGLSVDGLTTNVSREPDARTFTANGGITADTTYVIVVYAINEHGIGIQSEQASVTTDTFSTDPGILLVSDQNQILYFSVNEGNVMDSTMVEGTKQTLLLTNSTVLGIDYHYSRNEIYVTLNDSTIVRYSVNISLMEESSTFTVTHTDTEVIFSQLGDGLGAIAVDWVNDLLYWVQYDGSQSQLYSGSLDGGNINTLGIPVNGELDSLTVDPIHGYFYWVLINSSLAQIPLGSVMEADSLTNLIASAILQNDSSITAFYLDLADSQRLISSGTQVNLEGLDGDIRGFSTYTFSSSILTLYGVVSMVGVSNVIVFRNAETGMNLQGITNLNDTVGDSTIFRSTFQPLPVPPTPPSNIQVLASNTSTYIQWSVPQYPGDIFGVDAFSNWEYTVIYKPFNSSDSGNSSSTCSTSLTLISLTPGTVYQFTVTATGPGGSKTTAETYVFSTYGTDGDPQLLIATIDGILSSDVRGETPFYFQMSGTDRSISVVYNAHLDLYYIAIDTGTFLLGKQDTVDDILNSRSNPRFLQLDWISRRLYWVEESFRDIVRVPTSDITSSQSDSIEVFQTESANIIDMALDSINGVLFWITDSKIKAKTLNGLISYPCVDNLQNELHSITVDPINSRLFYIILTVDDVILGTVEYTINGCGESFERSVQKSNFQDGAISMSYAANTLFIAQFSSLSISFITAEFANIGSEYLLAMGTVEIKPNPLPNPVQFRDLSVILIDNQPLPDGLTADMTGNDVIIAPPIPGTPVLNEDTSNSTFIDITWNQPTFSFSALFYSVMLDLTSPFGDENHVEEVINTNSIQLTNQTFYTTVVANVTAYSLWLPTSLVTGTFLSPPKLPSKVQNVRVYVYFPIRNDTSVVSAQIVWDGLSLFDAGGVVEVYSVKVRDVIDDELITAGNVFDDSVYDGFWNGPPFLVDGDSTEFSLVLSGRFRYIYYPLRPDREYSVTVTACNSAGEGDPSDTVVFFTNISRPPVEVLISSPEGGRVQGMSTNTSLNEVTPPVAINTKNRTIFYYNNNDKYVYRRSLDANLNPEQLISLPDDLTPLGFSFDWIAQNLYIIFRNNLNGRVEICSVFELDPQLIHIYSGSEILDSDVQVSIIVNPFRGYIDWTQYSNRTGQSLLNRLNLRDNSVTTLISTVGSRKRNVNTEMLEITSALVLESTTDRIWLCDRMSGDIISCNVTSLGDIMCRVEVDHSEFTFGSGNDDGDIGLPADYLALDEDNIYWSNSVTPTVYYVTRTDRTIVLSFSVPNNMGVLLSTSPGIQPFPDSGDVHLVNMSGVLIASESSICLSPNLIENGDRPDPMLFDKTNTTLSIQWDVPSLPTICDDIVFSFLRFTYRVRIELNMDDVTIETVFEPMIVIYDLDPYTVYDIDVEATNQFTLLGQGQDTLFGVEREFRTLEGVPSQLGEVMAVTYGPRHIFTYWDPLTESTLRGPVENQAYFAFQDNISLSRVVNTDYTYNRLSPETSYELGILVNNGVLNSTTLSTVINSTFSLPPRPVLKEEELKNTSLVAIVTLNQNDSAVLTNVGMYIQQYGRQDTMQSSDTQPYDILSSESSITLEFNFTGLYTNTNYTLYTSGTYRNYSFNEYILPVISDISPSTNFLTAEGAPDAPNITLTSDGVLRWTKPDDNGASISRYILRFVQSDVDDVVPETQDLAATSTSTDLSTASYLDLGVEYTITLVAVNAIGSSEESEARMYTRREEEQPLFDPLVIAGISVGGAIFLIILFFIIIAICCCCCTRREKRHLIFGPDYELARLRAVYSNQSASNPHYLWSRDDYTAYEQDLEQLNKFPRNKLRLENFIDRGEFGEVYQGTAIDILGQSTGPTPVAVKTLKKGATVEEQHKFLSEAALMSNFGHQNIVKVLGVCLDNDPIYIIMELMPAGDLLKFLREARRDNGPPLLTLAELLQITIDVGQGCRYLEQQHFIHRDIAARNCLVTSKGAERVVKIGDFGLAKDLYSQDYYQVEGQRKLPVRWMAPEALLQGKFTIESDIWSYGVLLWEIMTFGNQPYPGRNNQEVVQFVTGDGRLDKPENCSIKLYKLMQACWEKSPGERLHFAQIVEYLAHYLEHVNNRRDSYYSEDEEDPEAGDDPLTRKNSARPSRSSSVRSGVIRLAREGSMRIRRSIRRNSLHRKEDMDTQNQINHNMTSEENLIDDDGRFRERGPF